MSKPETPSDPLLAEQIAHYRAIAGEYEDHAISEPGADDLTAALEAFRPAGHVLELACGPGAWTERLLRHATSVTAVDAAPEMLARARARVGDDRVRFIHADLFTWQPDRRYDVVFFGFWLSHVPLERFDAFWSLIGECLEPTGRVFFVDDNHRAPEELIEGESSSTVRRRLNDGSAHRIVKVPHRPADLEERLTRLGWRIQVAPTAGPFYWGAGRSGLSSAPNTKEANMSTTPDTTTPGGATSPRMQLDVKGAGPPLVLVGGGLTGWASWEPHQARVAPTRRVARAQPLSVQWGLEDRPLPPDYSVRLESRALAAGLDGLTPEGPVDVVAWSYGGLIALDFALERPDRVRTLTLIEPPAFWVLDATGTNDAEAQRELDETRALYMRMTHDVTEAQLADFVERVALCPPGKAPTELPAWPSWVEHRRSLRTGDAAWRHEDVADRLRSFQAPVLLVKGTGSSHFLHRILDGLASALPNAKMVELPGGHAPQLVAIDAFLERLAAFHREASLPPK